MCMRVYFLQESYLNYEDQAADMTTLEPVDMATLQPFSNVSISSPFTAVAHEYARGRNPVYLIFRKSSSRPF